MADVENVGQSAVDAASWSDTLKGHAQDAWAKVQESHSLLFTIAIYSGVGFVAGFLCKKYAHFLVLLIVLAVCVSVLQQMDYVSFSIQWERIYALLGVPSSADSSLINCFIDWVKNNITQMVSFVVGFLLGLRFG